MYLKINKKHVMLFLWLFILTFPFSTPAAVNVVITGSAKTEYYRNNNGWYEYPGCRHLCYWVPGQWIFRPVYHQPYWIPPHRQCYYYYD